VWSIATHDAALIQQHYEFVFFSFNVTCVSPARFCAELFSVELRGIGIALLGKNLRY
jgi:hypothetical protein